MANETIFGCIDWSDGSIEFTQDNCTYSACIIWTGIHAGQVSLTLDLENSVCDDTYYGCVNWDTGKFQVIIPTNCCACAPTITVTFADLEDCDYDCSINHFPDPLIDSLDFNVASKFNTLFTISTGATYPNCIWRKTLTSPDVGDFRFFQLSSCQGPRNFTDGEIIVNLSPGAGDTYHLGISATIEHSIDGFFARLFSYSANFPGRVPAKKTGTFNSIAECGGDASPQQVFGCENGTATLG